MTEENNDRMRMVSRIIMEVYLAEDLVLYYDSTTIQDYSFRKACWKRPDDKPIIGMTAQITPIKLLVTCTQYEVHSLQFFKHASSEQIYQFIYESVAALIYKYPKRRVWLLIDNATSHKNNEFINTIVSFNVSIIYNAISSPKLNLVEDVFEYLKRPIRRKTRLSPRTVIECMMDQARCLKSSHMQRIKNRQLQHIIDLTTQAGQQ